MRGFDVAVKAGIVHGGRVLLLTPSEPERSHEHDLPGGCMTYGEHPVAALRREVREETGLDVQPVALVRMWSMIRTSGQQLVGATWACRTSSARVRLSEEHLSYAWLAPEEIPEHWPERPELLAIFQILEAMATLESRLGSVHTDSVTRRA
jgi:8-oxo-dGTP diphosphatase